VDTVFSKILGEQRAAWIYVPPQDPNPAMAKKRFPVIYLLDGNEHFGFVTSIVRQFSEGFTHLLPEMIVVGIPNTDRMRDLTPTRIRQSPIIDSATAARTGGGPAFLRFLEKELIPYIDSAYPTVPYRTFIGHSLGGLMVIDALMHRRDLFNAYISIDPSLWYDNRALLKASIALLDAQDFSRETLYLGIANTMGPGMDTARVRKDTAESSMHIRSILDLAAALRKSPRHRMRWTYAYYRDDDHGSVPLISEYDGLRFVFRDYRLPAWEYLLDSTTVPDLVLKKQFEKLSVSWGSDVYPPEAFVNALAYTLMQQNRMGKALKLFQMNIDHYPASANAQDSMGDCLQAMGQTEKAAAAYRRSLEILETPQTRAKLNRIQTPK
jgi:predicted alpha/beta superfamily hydrolase